MSGLFPDTHPEAEAVLIRLLRGSPSWRKLEMVGQLNQAVKTMMFSGLRERYPQDSPRQSRKVNGVGPASVINGDKTGGPK